MSSSRWSYDQTIRAYEINIVNVNLRYILFVRDLWKKFLFLIVEFFKLKSAKKLLIFLYYGILGVFLLWYPWGFLLWYPWGF